MWEDVASIKQELGAMRKGHTHSLTVLSLKHDDRNFLEKLAKYLGNKLEKSTKKIELKR